MPLESSQASSSSAYAEPDYTKLAALLDVLQALGSGVEVDQETVDKAVADVFADFRLFCSLIEIRLKSRDQVPFTFEGWHDEQKDFERFRTGLDLILKARQIGVTTLELARDFWFAVVNRGVNVLVIVHDPELADQLFLNLRIFADCLQALGLLPRKRYSTKRELVFADTGSAIRIVEAGETDRSASKKGRSGTIHRLHATEVAFWGAPAETMAAVLSAVPDDGEVVIESTANGAGGLFYEDVVAAQQGRTRYRLHFYAWFKHRSYRLPVPPGFDPTPRDDHEKTLRAAGVDDEQMTWWRAKVDDPKVGLEKALQEYPIDIETCFRASGEAWLPAAALDAMAPRVRAPKRQMPVVWKGRVFHPANIYADPVPGRAYVLFGDVAEGVARDGSSITVLDKKSGDTVAVWWDDATEPGDFGTVMCVLGWAYNGAKICPERNNHGHACLERIVTVMKYQNVFAHDDGKPGWLTDSRTRPILFDELGLAIREGAVWTPDAATLGECKTIVKDDDGKPRARGKKKKSKDACRDDRFVSWAGAWQLRNTADWSFAAFNIKGA